MAGERQLLHQWRWALRLGALFLIAASLLTSSQQTWWDIDWREWVGNTVPEFLGAIVIALFVGWFLRDDDRKKYVTGMQSIRGAVGLRNLPETEVQELMCGVVRSVSLLYFGTAKPAPDYGPAWSVDTPTKCGTCRSPQHEPVMDGRCTRCFDLVESWRNLDSAAAGPREVMSQARVGPPA